MNRTYTYAIAALLIGLVIGAAIVWAVKPAPTDVVPRSDYDNLQTNYNNVNGNLTAALAQIANLTTPIKIGLVLATGGLGDKSFNDICYAGLQRAKTELNITFDYVQPQAIAEYAGFQTGFASTGQYALIVCIGFDQADPLNATATAYPNQKFAIVDMVVSLPNIASLVFKANEGSFLTGVVAGMLTKTGKIGFVGGMDIPLIRDFYVGYKAGVEWANASVTVFDPVFVGSWRDATKAKELTVSLIGLGADSVFSVAGGSGLGALEAVHENGIMGYGVDSCQDYLYPPTYPIKASATKRVDTAIFEIVQGVVISKLLPDLKTGGFKAGIYNGGLKEKWTGCSRLPEEEPFWESTFNFTETPLPENVLSKLTDARDRIISGNITVPSGYT